MNKPSPKDLAYYINLPYTVVMRVDEDGDVVAHIQELSGCMGHGQNAGEAWEHLREVQRAWIEDCIEAGDPVPEPEPEEELPSGKWLQRVPRTLHRKLTQLAKRENVSLNQLVTTMLSECVAHKTWNGGLEDLLTEWANQTDCSDPWERPVLINTAWNISPDATPRYGLQMLSHLQKLLSPQIQKTKLIPSDADNEETAHYWK